MQSELERKIFELLTHGYPAPFARVHSLAKQIAALVDVPAVEPVGYASEYGLKTLAGKAHHYCLSVNKRPENEFAIPLYTHPPHREGEDSAEVDRLTRPIVGIENRTAQEVFDIMADRIRLAATRSASATTANGGGNV